MSIDKCEICGRIATIHVWNCGRWIERCNKHRDFEIKDESKIDSWGEGNEIGHMVQLH